MWKSKNKKIQHRNLWKAVKITQEKPQSSYRDEMKHFEGRKLKTDQEKADGFAQTFAKKTEKVVEKVKVKEREVYNGKRKNFQLHEENWLTKDLVEKTLIEL